MHYFYQQKIQIWGALVFMLLICCAVSQHGFAQPLSKEWLVTHLEQIQKPQSLSEVKALYLNPRTHPELPVAEGIKLIDAAYTAETVGSKRWFALANVRCYANLRFKIEPKSEALKDYSAFFSKATEASQSGADPLIRNGISDFIDLTLSHLVRDDIKAIDFKTVALDAFRAFIISEGKAKKQGRPIRWAKWLTSIYFPTTIIDFAQTHIDDPTLPQTFAVQAPLALAYSMRDQDRIKLLKVLSKAKAVVPVTTNGFPDENQVDLDDVAFVCEAIIRQVRQSNSQSPEERELVLAVAEDSLCWTGSGADRLASYYFEYFGEPPGSPTEIARIDKLRVRLSKKETPASILLSIAKQLYAGGFFEEDDYLRSDTRLEASLKFTQWILENPETYSSWDAAEANILRGAVFRAQEKDTEMKSTLDIKWPTPENSEQQSKLRQMKVRKEFLLKPHDKFARYRPFSLEK